jgi:hypothetical protein
MAFLWGLSTIVVVVLAIYFFAYLMKQKGYSFGKNTIVKCGKGELYTTIWIPGGSLKAIRWGMIRYQWCPVGKHFSSARIMRASDLSNEEIAIAGQVHDIYIP